MIGLPKTYSIPCPFADQGEKASNFPNSSGIENISYQYGIPVAYSVSTANGGIKFTRQEMNRLGYISTIGTFLEQCGVPATFRKSVSDAIGGYPKGSILKYIDDENGIVNDVISLKDDNKTDYRDKPYPYEPGISYSVGEVVRVYSSTIGSKTEFKKCIGAVSASSNTSWNDVSSYFSDVSSTATPTTVGPDGVYWDFVDKVNKNFWPNLEINDNSPTWTQSTKQSTEFDKVEASQTGWLYVRAKREELDFDNLAANQIKSCLQTYVRVKIASEYSMNSGNFSAMVNLMALQENSVLVPVIKGSLYTISVSNPGLENLTVSVWEIGTVSS